MLNRVHRAFLLTMISLSLLAPPASVHASGTIPLSMTQQLDQYGVPLSGCLLYTIQAGTTSTPQASYKDTALTASQVQPNPMVCDSSGRLPQFFLADGQIKIRLLDRLGNPQVVLDNILVIGPTSGGGSGATIDPTTIAATGDLKQVYGTQTLTGWVRFNGRTIGSATSGATERANADTSALFVFLWTADATLTVSGGRTTAAADFAANKTITLPDGRGRSLSGLDDMGNSAAGRLTATYFGASGGCSGVLGTTLGAACGGETAALTSMTQVPSHQHNVYLKDPGHTHTALQASQTRNDGTSVASLFAFATVQATSSSLTGMTIGSVNGTANDNLTTAAGQATPSAFKAISPRILVTIYIKL
jgi:hypothetical protein